jgi:hypothetical protein
LASVFTPPIGIQLPQFGQAFSEAGGIGIYIRRLLVGGALAVIRHARGKATAEGEWLRAMLARKPAKVVALALANKTARIAWAVMKQGEAYQPKEKFVGRAG